MKNRKEIEEKINELWNEYAFSFDGELYRQILLLKWVLGVEND